MRSRYAAYALGLRDYLAATWHAGSRPDLSQVGDEAGIWQRLEILRTEGGTADDSQGTVTFKAHWQHAGRRGCLHETSRFVREEGRWYYLDGEIHPEQPSGKPGRNAECPCGSGKKYKRCCGGT
jgi:SEC-C motif-containing protein